MLEIEYARATDVGRVRDHNEDCLGEALPRDAVQSRTQGYLFVLADGVGGHERGEVASRLAVETLVNGFRAAPAGQPHAALLSRLVQHANSLIYNQRHDAGAQGMSMATTVVSCALRFDRCVVAHVGDSRAYLLRGAQVTALTRDHSVAAEQLSLGVVTSDEAGATRHLLTRSVGHDLFVQVDVGEHQVQPGDVLLLCSDGLHGSVVEADLVHLLRQPQLEIAVQQLIALANERDGSDNCSVQAVRIRQVERTGVYRGRPYALR